MRNMVTVEEFYNLLPMGIELELRDKDTRKTLVSDYGSLTGITPYDDYEVRFCKRPVRLDVYSNVFIAYVKVA